MTEDGAVTEFLLANEPFIRLAAFIGVFAAMALLEVWLPRRRRTVSRWLRWPNNMGLTFLNTMLVRVLFPTALAGVALFAETRDLGILRWLGLPEIVAVVIAVLALDLVIYAQHVVLHMVPLLWPLHRVHHADVEVDVTTGFRFHPLEIFLSLAIKGVVVVVLGAPVAAVVVFEVLLSATSLFNHANVRLPRGVERILRAVVVTPDMHRVHHSIERQERDSNFGFNLPWWDRLFGTYRAEPALGHEAMTLGLPGFRERREIWLDRLLLHPVLDDKTRRG